MGATTIPENSTLGIAETIARISGPISNLIPTGTERFWAHSALLAFLYVSTHHLPQAVPQLSLSNRPQQSSPAIGITEPPLPISVRMGQDYLKLKSPTRTINGEVYELSLQFKKNEQLGIKRTLGYMGLINSVVTDPRLDIPKEDQPFWSNLMLELIFWETKGGSLTNPADYIKDPQERIAAQKNSPTGITQLLPGTAQELKIKYLTGKNDLTNKDQTDIFLSFKYLLELSNMYGPELGPWAYHMGPGNMNTALITYLTQVKKLPYGEITSDFNKFGGSKIIRKKYVQKYGIRPNDLKAPAVTGALKSKDSSLVEASFNYSNILEAAGLAMGLDWVSRPQTKG